MFVFNFLIIVLYYLFELFMLKFEMSYSIDNLSKDSGTVVDAYRHVGATAGCQRLDIIRFCCRPGALIIKLLLPAHRLHVSTL